MEDNRAQPNHGTGQWTLQVPTYLIRKLWNWRRFLMYDILRLHRDYSQITNPFARSRGRPRILDNGDVEYVHALLQANPTLYLDELQEQLFAARDKDVSLAPLSRVIRRLALTHKRVSKTAAERNELLRATWQAEYGDIPAEYFVWLDASTIRPTRETMDGQTVDVLA